MTAPAISPARRWDGSIEEWPIWARVTVQMATGARCQGIVLGNGAAENGFGEWTEVRLDGAESGDRFHRSRLILPSEADRRCPDCQNWLDRYGRCLQCAEPAGEREPEL